MMTIQYLRTLLKILLFKIFKVHACLHPAVRLFQDLVSESLRESKASYFYNYFQKNSNNMKQLWSGIKSVISIQKSSNVNVISKLKDSNGNVTSDPAVIASIFNKYFVNVSHDITKAWFSYHFILMATHRRHHCAVKVELPATHRQQVAGRAPSTLSQCAFQMFPKKEIEPRSQRLLILVFDWLAMVT